MRYAISGGRAADVDWGGERKSQRLQWLWCDYRDLAPDNPLLKSSKQASSDTFIKYNVLGQKVLVAAGIYGWRQWPLLLAKIVLFTCRCATWNWWQSWEVQLLGEGRRDYNMLDDDEAHKNRLTVSTQKFGHHTRHTTSLEDLVGFSVCGFWDLRCVN